MSNASNSYKSILKGSVLFGGVQVFNILINLIRGKLIALLLGPEGMGISSLLSASANTIQQFSGFGLNLSSVKELSEAKEKDNVLQIQTIIVTVRRLLFLTALIGSLFSIFFCGWLSEWTFGNAAYKWHFAFLSLMIFFTTLSNGELSILQGLHAIKKLALASIIGSSIGLFIGVPLYYFYGYNGIVPAMIVLSLATFLFYRYHSYQLVKIPNLKRDWRKMFPLAKKMISLGIIMIIATLLGTFTNYMVNTFIGKTGSLNDVGLFQAANSITNQYIGLVFTAMGMDFFPRLSAVSSDTQKIRELVNQQTEIVILISIPLAILLIITAPLLIKILLTDQFLTLVPVIRWMGLGIAFKAIAFPMGYISFAKGDKRTFFWLEGIWGNVLMLCLNITFYYYWGVYGLGVSFAILYIISCLLYKVLTCSLYHFTHNFQTILLSAKALILLIICFGISFINNVYISYGGMIIIGIISTFFSAFELEKRTNFCMKIIKRKTK